MSDMTIAKKLLPYVSLVADLRLTFCGFRLVESLKDVNL